MSTPLSERVQRIKPSPTLAVTAKANELKASPEQIKASRAKLEQSLAGIQSATCPLDAQEGM